MMPQGYAHGGAPQQYQQQFYQQNPAMQPQMNPMMQQNQNWARMQLHQLMQFYPNVLLEKQTAEGDSYRVPIMLAVSKTPLYIRIDCSKSFPQQRPNLIVLARVVHPEIHPKSKVINTQLLQHWDIFQNNSTLLNVIRDIHSRFDSNPPIPEKLAQKQNQDSQMQNSSQQPQQNPKPQEQPQVQEQQQPSLNIDPQTSVLEEKKDVIKKSAMVEGDLAKIESKLTRMDEEARDKLQALELTEIKYMHEDEAYLKDFCLSVPQYIQLDKIHDEAQDIAQKLAQKNVERQKEIDEYTESNSELQTEFEAKQAELKQLLEQYKQKQATVNCDIGNLIKVMSHLKANELNKENQKILKQFKKGELSCNEYVDAFKVAKQSHSQAYYTQLALQQKQQRIQNRN